MKKVQFLRLEKLCKEVWTELSLTGEDQKPVSVQGYINQCPACSIAKGSYYQNCRLCPIDVWRKRAYKLKIFREGMSVCERKSGEFYKWKYSENFSDLKKKYAKLIAGYKWTYLPEYTRKNIK